MRKRRVLVVPEWYPWPHAPGLGVWAREQARAVSARNEVAVLASAEARHEQRYTVAEDIEDDLRVARVRFRRSAVSQLTFANRLAGMVAALRRLRDEGFQPDVVHAHVFSAGFPSLALGWLSACPVVVSEHYSGLPLGLLSRWDRLIARVTFRRASLVCPASDALASSIAQLAPSARLRTVPNAVDTSVFRPPSADERDDRSELRALCVGALKERKGHLDLLEAAASARRERPDLVLELLGDGPLRGSLEARAAELGLGDSVRFLGARRKHDVAARMRQAHFLVLPSLWENAPLAAIEALASGLPVVATRVGGIPEIVDARMGILVPPGDARALSGAILAMVERRTEFDAAALAAGARVRFGYPAVAGAWEDVYAESEGLRRKNPTRWPPGPKVPSRDR